MNIHLEMKKEELEKRVVLYAIGILEGLENHRVTLEEADHLLFYPQVAVRLKEAEVNEKVVELICQGCELCEYTSANIKHYDQHYDQMVRTLKQEAKQLLKEMPPIENMTKKMLKYIKGSDPT